MGQNRIALAVVAASLLAWAFTDVAGRALASPVAEAPVYPIENYPFPNAAALVQWRSVLARDADQEARWTGGTCKNGLPHFDCAAKAVRLLEDELRDRTPVEQISAVYSYFNAFRYKEHGRGCTADCWATRLQFMVRRQGDCGDHALAEYFTLRRLGFEERDLQLIVAQLPGNEDSFRGGHAVLRVFAAGHYYILDNRRTDLTGLSGLRKYKVLAGLNADSVQIYNVVTPEPPAGFVTDENQLAEMLESPNTGQLAGITKAKPEKKTGQPVLLASTDTATDNAAAADQQDSSGDCIQEARSLADWNPYLPCLPGDRTKQATETVADQPASPPATAPATVETAADPTPAESQLVEIPPAISAPAAGASESGCLQDAKLADWNPDLPCAPVTRTRPTAAAPSPEPAKQPVIAAKTDEVPAVDSSAGPSADPQGCVQSAKLGNWTPNLPCTPAAHAYRIKVKVKSETTDPRTASNL